MTNQRFKKSILLRYPTEIVAQLAGLRRGQSSQQSAIDTQTALIETAQAASGSQPDTCLLCGRRANDIYNVDDLFKLAYGLCWTCSAKSGSHVMACDMIARRLPQTVVMSRNA